MRKNIQLLTLLLATLTFVTVTSFSDFLHHHEDAQEHNDQSCEYSLLLSQNSSTDSNVTPIELFISVDFRPIVWFYNAKSYTKQPILNSQELLQQFN